MQSSMDIDRYISPFTTTAPVVLPRALRTTNGGWKPGMVGAVLGSWASCTATMSVFSAGSHELDDLVAQPFSVPRHDGGVVSLTPVAFIVAVLQPASTTTEVLVCSASRGAPSSGDGGGAAGALITQRAGAALRAQRPARRMCVSHPGDTRALELRGGP